MIIAKVNLCDMKKENAQESLNKRALKAGVWYIVSAVLIRGLNFITTPIFSRLLTKQEYGLYSNYSTWLHLLTTVVTLDLFTSVSRAKIDYTDDMDSYVYSMQVLGTLCTGIVYIVFVTFSRQIQAMMELDMKYIHIMFLYLLVAPALTLLQTKERQFLRYKRSVLLTMISSLLSVGMSLLLVFVMEDRFQARVLGSSVTLFVFCLIIYIHNGLRGKKIKKSYWKYGAYISVPLIPHILAGNILSQIDRVVIIKFCGSADNAIYSLGYQSASIVMILGNMINQAWTPWEFQKLHEKRYAEIRKVSKIYIIFSGVFTVLIMLFAPEIVGVFGGSKYRESIQLVPIIMAGIYCWLLYTLFINIENYNKKTFGISVKTIIAAGVNLAANYLLIPRYGYIMAAYTTLASYILLMILHAISAAKLEAGKVYEFKYIFTAFVVVLAISIPIQFVYENRLAHMSSLIAAVSVMAVFAIYYRDKIKTVVLKYINRKSGK